MNYDIGDLVRLTGTFTDLDGTATDPSGITMSIKIPNGTVTTLTYGVDGSLYRSSTGIYYTDFAPTMEGLHYYRFAGTGAVTAAEEQNFYVRKRQTS
jgi:hypothetical protein